MKLKYIIPSLIAAIALLAGCSDDETMTLLNEVRVSSSYVAIPVDGGSTSITVTAQGDWTIDTTGVSKWLTVSPLTGTAGETNVTFTAPSTLDGRSADLPLVCAGKTQHINVIQGLATITDATCKEVIDGPDNKTFRVTGTCTAIANTSYGNFYLADATGQIYIYGTKDAKGNYNWSSFNIEVGDEVTVQGPKKTYSGTVELVDATFIKVVKSLIKVDSTEVAGVKANELPLEGGEFKVYLMCKGQGVSVDIPEDAKNWLSISSIQSTSKGAVVTFKGAANTGGDRSTTIIFHTTDGKKDYTAQTSLTQKGAILEVSVADFNAAAVGDAQYRLTGVITQIANAARGRFYIKDWSGETYVYNLADFEKSGAKVGDIITVVGKRGQYGETIEMVSPSIEKLMPVTAVSIADFLTKADSKDVYYMVTGTVSEIKNATYGNLYLQDGDNTLYVYGCYPGYGATGDNRKNFLATAGIEVGEKLTVIGYKSTYNGTPQLAEGFYFSHEDK